jgi:FlaA1/EpsC-like NDP-sugar epimerase
MIEQGKRYLVTGGTGFLGEKLIERLYGKCRLVVFSRNEGKLIALKERYPAIEILTGDVSNQFEVHAATRGVSGVFHLAAFKHVGMAEAQAYECVNSNLVGSLNILENSTHCDFVLGVSTDKAAQVNGVYGATKLLMERLFKQYEAIYPSVKYRIVRYGNVLGSTGSVITKWIPLMRAGKEIIVTDPEATRFYWTVDQAVDLLMDGLYNATSSAPYCPDMKALSIGDLVKACHAKYGVGPLTVKQIGLQPGENKHERVLDNGKYSNEVEQFTLAEIMEMV